MLNDDEKSRIDELRKSLYSKANPPAAVVKRRKMHEIPHNVQENWAEEKEVEEGEKHEVVYQGRYSGLFKGLLIFAVCFFVVSAGIATYVYFRGTNIVSPNNITLSVIGPVSVGAGDVLSIDVDITNRNNSPLQLADLTFDYPDGTKSAADFTTDLKSDQLSVDTLASGQTIRKTAKSVLYGKENTKDDIKITLTYRIPGSNAVFTKETDYGILLASAPVSVDINSLSEVISNQDLNINAHIVSNSPVDLHNLLFRIDYPFGFSFESATPTPTYQNNIWNLGNLSQGDSRDITLVGKITGQDSDQRVFHFYTGTASSSDQSKINTLFINSSQTVAITRPFLESTLTLDGDPLDKHVIESGKIIHGEVDFRNNLSTPVNDVAISVILDGSIIDKSSVDAEQGFYQSGNNTITWDKSDDNDLITVPPGGTGKVFFNFNAYKPTFDVSKSFRNPIINLTESIQAKRFSDNNVPESITSNVSHTARVASDLTLSSAAVYSIGPFANSGYLPPQADQTTTYTINLALTNSYNQVDNTVVSVTLPPYVKWLGKIAPAAESVSYNSVTRQVSWNVGKISIGTGFINSPKALSFQVALTPSVSQVGTSPDLITGISVQGTDNFTGTSVTNVTNSVNTRISTDPTFHNGMDQVIR